MSSTFECRWHLLRKPHLAYFFLTLSRTTTVNHSPQSVSAWHARHKSTLRMKIIQNIWCIRCVPSCSITRPSSPPAYHPSSHRLSSPPSPPTRSSPPECVASRRVRHFVIHLVGCRKAIENEFVAIDFSSSLRLRGGLVQCTSRDVEW